MQWIERIDRVGGRLVPVYVDQDGLRTIGSLRTSKTLMPPRGYKTANVEGASLSSMRVTDAREYLEGIGFAHSDPTGHQVFALPLNGRRVLIPSAVLMCALIGRISAVGDRLLEAASLDRIAVPAVVDETLEIKFSRKAGLTQDARLSPVQARFTWLTCFATARRMWNSVYVNAVEGRLGMFPANATFDASLMGHRTADTVFVTRMFVRSLLPTEPPLPFAAPYVSGPFNFDRVGRADNPLAVFRAGLKATGELHPCCTQQSDISRGTTGWRMSPNEWQLILGELRKAGFKSPVSVEGNVNMALEKLATGAPWSSLGPGWRSAQTIYQHWLKRGQWELLKRLLTDLRGKGGV